MQEGNGELKVKAGRLYIYVYIHVCGYIYLYTYTYVCRYIIVGGGYVCQHKNSKFNSFERKSNNFFNQK